MPRLLRPRHLALSAVALTLLVGCAAATPPAATIGGTKITDAQLAHEVAVFSFLAGLSRQPCGTADPGESTGSACARYALSNVIEEHVAAVYAAAHSITVADAQVRQTLKRLDGQLGAKTIDDQLKQHGLTRQDLSDLAHRVLLFGAVQQAVTVAAYPDAALQQLYQQQILDYTTVQVEHILVKTKAEAEQVYRQVTAPGATEQTFLDLAKQVSIDPSAAQNSGSLGSAVASTYVPEFGQAAAALEPGQISKPVHTQFGWHVIRLVTKDVQPFEQVRQNLLDSRSIVAFNGWIRDQITKAGVEVNPRYGRYDLTTLTVVRISSTAAGSGTPSTPTPVASASP